MGSTFIMTNRFFSRTCVFYIWGWWCGSPCLCPAAFSWRLLPAGDIAPALRGSAEGRAWGQCCALTRSSRWSRPEDTQTQTHGIHHCLRAAGPQVITHSPLSSQIAAWIIWCSTWQLTLANITRMWSLRNLRSLGLNYWGRCMLWIERAKNEIRKTKVYFMLMLAFLN